MKGYLEPLRRRRRVACFELKKKKKKAAPTVVDPGVTRQPQSAWMAKI